MKKTFFILLAALLVLNAGCAQKSAPIRGQHVEPGYTYEEPGHWELTDTLYYDVCADKRQGSQAELSLSRDEKGYAVFTFTVTEEGNFSGEEGHSCRGETAAFTVEAFWLEERYYPSSSVQPGFNLVREADTAHTPGDVRCDVFIGDIEPLEDGAWSARTQIRSRFTNARGETIESFSIGENMTQATGYDGKKYYLTPTGHLPAGEEDGEKLYVVLTAADSEGLARAGTAWEYTWAAQPETIVVEDRYGPIEYFETGPAAILGYGALALCILIPAAVVVVLLLVHRRKKRRK